MTITVGRTSLPDPQSAAMSSSGTLSLGGTVRYTTAHEFEVARQQLRNYRPGEDIPVSADAFDEALTGFYRFVSARVREVRGLKNLYGFNYQVTLARVSRNSASGIVEVTTTRGAHPNGFVDDDESTRVVPTSALWSSDGVGTASGGSGYHPHKFTDTGHTISVFSSVVLESGGVLGTESSGYYSFEVIPDDYYVAAPFVEWKPAGATDYMPLVGLHLPSAAVLSELRFTNGLFRVTFTPSDDNDSDVLFEHYNGTTWTGDHTMVLKRQSGTNLSMRDVAPRVERSTLEELTISFPVWLWDTSDANETTIVTNDRENAYMTMTLNRGQSSARFSQTGTETEPTIVSSSAFRLEGADATSVSVSFAWAHLTTSSNGGYDMFTTASGTASTFLWSSYVAFGGPDLSASVGLVDDGDSPNIDIAESMQGTRRSTRVVQ
jgi:hypothetical protein